MTGTSSIDGGGLRVPALTGVFPTIAQQYETMAPKIEPITGVAFGQTATVPETSVSYTPDVQEPRSYIQINGLSQHVGDRGQDGYYDRQSQQRRDYQETNLGIGYQRQIGHSGFSWSVGAYNNSYADPTVYGTISYETRSILGNPHFTTGVEAGAFYGYRDRDGDATLTPMIAPFVTARIPDNPVLPDESRIKVSLMPMLAARGTDVKAVITAQLLIPL